jgi:hypothetical protein
MPDLETPAATVTESAPVVTTETPAPPAPLPELSSLTPEERQAWRDTGNLPKKQDSAPAKKTAVADSAPRKDGKAEPDSAPEKKDAAPDSAPDTQKPKQFIKTKEETDRRISQLLDEVKVLSKKLEYAEREKVQPKTEPKQEPAAETYKPLDEKEFFNKNPKATYEDFVRAAGKHEGIWAARQEIALENQRRAQAEAQKELSSKIEEAKARYPDFEDRVHPAIDSIMDDKQIPFPVKATLNDSPVFTDLMYVLSEPKALQDLVQTAKSNPTAALRKIFITEQLIQAELAKGKNDSTGKETSGEQKTEDRERGEDGKFVSKKEEKAPAEPITRAPRPPVEVGGRSSAPEDGEHAAVKSGDFRAAKAAFDRKYAADHKL